LKVLPLGINKKIYFVIPSLYRTFAAVNVMTKRNIASWVLLAVFVPMVILSSLHIHESSNLFGNDCKECLQHQCHGHLGELTVSMHDCVLCQFLTMSFLAATVFVVVLFNNVLRIQVAWLQGDIQLENCGIPTLRAPPFVCLD